MIRLPKTDRKNRQGSILKIYFNLNVDFLSLLISSRSVRYREYLTVLNNADLLSSIHLSKVILFMFAEETSPGRVQVEEEASDRTASR